MNTADVLEQAADLLFVYGRCKGTAEDARGRLCVRGAMRKAMGLDPEDVMGWRAPANEALMTYLAAHPDVLPVRVVRRNPDWVARGSFPDWVWSDKTDDDELVIDTLRRCAKDLRAAA